MSSPLLSVLYARRLLARFKVLFPSDQAFIVFNFPSLFSESPTNFNEGDSPPEVQSWSL